MHDNSEDPARQCFVGGGSTRRQRTHKERCIRVAWTVHPLLVRWQRLSSFGGKSHILEGRRNQVSIRLQDKWQI